MADHNADILPADPDAYRMTLGDHLDELRKRLMYAGGGFFLAWFLCAWWAPKVIEVFCRPLINVLQSQHISPQLYFNEAGDVFSVYMEISLISAAVLASPWIIWQFWQFVAAGLYPKERKAVWRYAPLSVILMLSGVVMCYFLVLPLALNFFIAMSNEFPLHLADKIAPPTTQPAFHVQALAGDPASPSAYQLWFDTTQQRLKLALPDAAGKVEAMVIPFGPRSLVSPLITLPEYINMVLRWLLVFAVSFQLPLVTLALVSIGLVELTTLTKFRRYVYLILAVLSAFLIPELLTGMLALMLPLCLLYELGILLARLHQRKHPAT